MEDWIRPEWRHRRDEIVNFLFEDPESEKEQSGKFKLEGIWRHGLFRSAKAYYLDSKTGDTMETVARMRSIARKHQSKLSVLHFGQNPLTNTAIVRGAEMRPTAALEVVMQRQGKKLSHALNLKRKMIVREKKITRILPLPY